MAKCKNCINLEKHWCDMVADSPDENVERECLTYERMTNGDKIRSMSDEELAEWLTNMWDFVNPDDEEPYKSIYNLDTESEEIVHDSYGSIMDWLQSEVE